MTTFLRTVRAEEARGKLKELYDEDQKLYGRVRGATEMLSLRPEVSQAWRAMDGALQSTMDPRHYELATIVAATASVVVPERSRTERCSVRSSSVPKRSR